MNKKLFFVLTVAVLLIATACENDGYGGYGGGGYGGSSYSGGGYGGGISTGGGGTLGSGGGSYGGGGIFGGGITTGGGGGILGGGYGGGGGSGGTFTLTGISQYDGYYAMCVVVNTNDPSSIYDSMIVGYQNLLTAPSLCRISGGKVSIPLWRIDFDILMSNPYSSPSSYIKGYSGSGTYTVGVAIFSTVHEVSVGASMPSSSGSVAAVVFESVRFSGGSGSSSWSQGNVSWSGNWGW